MSKNSCPFLGLQEDPSTSLSFPSEGNFCHHALPVSRVRSDYQQKFCLTGEHINCPVYRSRQPVPLPAELATAPLSKASTRSMLVTLGVPALVVGAAALALTWNAFGASLGAITNSIPNTGMSQSGAGSLSLLPDVQTPAQGATPSALQIAQVPNCPMPDGYIPYTVNPTDSLFRLSVVYGVSVEELQRKNCMETQTVLLPGQVIYVPDLPASTPTAVPTPHYFSPSATNQPASNNTSSNPKPPPPVKAVPTNTPLPPVKAVPTNAPLPPVKATNPPPPTKPGRTWPTVKPPSNNNKIKPTKDPNGKNKDKPKQGGHGHNKPKKKK